MKRHFIYGNLFKNEKYSETHANMFDGPYDIVYINTQTKNKYMSYTHTHTKIHCCCEQCHIYIQKPYTGTILMFLWISNQFSELCNLNFIQSFSRTLLNNSEETIDYPAIKF